MISWLLFKQIVVLFVMMGMGWLVVKIKFLKPEDSRILSVVCLYLVVPCMQIEAFQIHYSDTILNGFLLALLSACIMHAMLFGITYGVSRPFHLTNVERGSLIYTNAGNLIVPLVTSVLGRNWVIYASAFMFVQALLLWSHGKMMMQPGGRIDFKKVFLNVNIIATLLGVSLFLGHVEIHGIPSDVLNGVSQMLGPISMITIADDRISPSRDFSTQTHSHLSIGSQWEKDSAGVAPCRGGAVGSHDSADGSDLRR